MTIVSSRAEGWGSLASTYGLVDIVIQVIVPRVILMETGTWMGWIWQSMPTL